KELSVNYSKKTVHALALARKTAQEFGDSKTEFKHVVLAILQAGNSVTAKVLEKYGVNLQTVQEGMPPKGEPTHAGFHSEFLVNILEAAELEAKELESQEICPA